MGNRHNIPGGACPSTHCTIALTPSKILCTYYIKFINFASHCDFLLKKLFLGKSKQSVGVVTWSIVKFTLIRSNTHTHTHTHTHRAAIGMLLCIVAIILSTVMLVTTFVVYKRKVKSIKYTHIQDKH